MKLTIRGLQSAGTPGDVPANLAELDAAARDAAAAGVDLLVTTEMFVTGYDIGSAVRDLARPDLIEDVASICRRHGVAIVAGLPVVDGDALYNAAVVIDAEGTVTAQHRKSHLFGALDREFYTAGSDSVTVVDVAGVRLGVLICYDVEFPENVRAAALAGVHVLVVPTALMEPFAFVADVVIPVRAWENQMYVAYVDHVGAEGETTYVGRSSIVGPDAVVLDRRVTGTGPITATVDTEIVDAARRANPYLTDRRPELYGPVVSPRS